MVLDPLKKEELFFCLILQKHFPGLRHLLYRFVIARSDEERA